MHIYRHIHKHFIQVNYNIRRPNSNQNIITVSLEQFLCFYHYYYFNIIKKQIISRAINKIARVNVNTRDTEKVFHIRVQAYTALYVYAIINFRSTFVPNRQISLISIFYYSCVGFLTFTDRIITSYAILTRQSTISYSTYYMQHKLNCAAFSTQISVHYNISQLCTH